MIGKHVKAIDENGNSVHIDKEFENEAEIREFLNTKGWLINPYLEDDKTDPNRPIIRREGMKLSWWDKLHPYHNFKNCLFRP